jgi:hypothetical protein
MTRLHKIAVNPLLDARVDHHLRAFAIRAGESWRRSEQAANQRAFRVGLAASLNQVRATLALKRRRMLRVTLDGEPCHFFA